MSDNKPRVKFRNMYTHKKINYNWVITISIITFFLAILLGYSSLVLMDLLNMFWAVLILFVIVFMGIFFDLLGIAVTAADEIPFHSMAASKVYGAKASISIIRNAGAVANFFNDVIGDIAGIISGSASAAIIVKLTLEDGMGTTVVSILLTAVIAAMTVGGKAIGKEISLRHANFIVYQIGRILTALRGNRG